MTCEAAGLRPGTRRFERCQDVNFAQHRAQAGRAEAAVATAAAAGLIGGALAGAAASRPYTARHTQPIIRFTDPIGNERGACSERKLGGSIEYCIMMVDGACDAKGRIMRNMMMIALVK